MACIPLRKRKAWSPQMIVFLTLNTVHNHPKKLLHPIYGRHSETSTFLSFENYFFVATLWARYKQIAYLNAKNESIPQKFGTMIRYTFNTDGMIEN